MCSFHILLSIFGCHGNAVCFIENSDSILFFIRGPPKPYFSQFKLLDFLHRTEISAILIDVFLNSFAMVTLFGPLKFPLIYVNSLTPNTLLFTQKKSQYFIQK